MRRGELFILSAPSGTGKTTLIHHLFEHGVAKRGGMEFSISHTTRPRRQGETDGVDYHFVEKAAFQRMVSQDQFLEWAEVHGNYYGTSKTEVFSRLETGVDVLLDIDVQGAERVMAQHPEAVGIFILPPSYRDLEDRLRRRGLDDEAQIERRLAVSLWEIRRFPQYQYVIINDDARQASEALASIVIDKRHRLPRMEDRAARIVDDFEQALRPDDVAVAAPRGAEEGSNA